MVVKTWNVGVIGYGFSAKIFHIPFITAVPDLKLYAVVQRNPTAENDATRDFPGVKSYRSVEELLKDDEVDVVVVTTPPDSHYALAKAALAAGKHGTLLAFFLFLSFLQIKKYCLTLMNSCGGEAVCTYAQRSRRIGRYSAEVQQAARGLSK